MSTCGREFHPGNPDSHHQTGSTKEPGFVSELSGKNPDFFSQRFEHVLNNGVLHRTHDKVASRRDSSPDDAYPQIHDVHDSRERDAEQLSCFDEDFTGKLVPLVRGL